VVLVEEAVRRPLVGDELVLDAGGRQRGGVLLVQRGRDQRVVAGLEREDRRAGLRGAQRRAVARHEWVLPREAVEADGAVDPVLGGRREPRLAAAEAEADREARRAPLEASEGGGDVELDLLRR